MTRIAVPSLLLLLTACSSDHVESASTQPPEVAAAVEPSTAEAAVETPEVAEPEPEPEPEPPANAEPAQLRMAFHGRCKMMGMSFVDEQEFVHYTTDNVQLHRMDSQGAVAETIDFDARLDVGYDELFASHIEQLTGRWPDQLVAVTQFSDRETDKIAMYRLADARWKRVKTPARTTDFKQAWPWHQRSILALAVNEDDDKKNPRLVVVRGQPKGRSLAPIRRRGKCRGWYLSVGDLHPGMDGSLTLMAKCNRLWMAHWAPGQEEPELFDLGSDSSNGSLMLGEDGEGYVSVDSTLMEWRGGALQPMALPSGEAPSKIGSGAEGRPFITQGRQVLQWTGTKWEPTVTLPDDAGRVYGIAEGTPWTLKDTAKGQPNMFAMMTADGAWHDVPLAPDPKFGVVPDVTAVHVVGPGDLWVETDYYKQNKRGYDIGRRYWALYTTRPVSESRRCT